VLTRRVLNRTLLQRQHLLSRVDMPALALTEHLLGLQAQDVSPPYLSLWARLERFDPHEPSDALDSRAAVRLLLMRGTIHLVTAEDCRFLRPLVQPALDRLSGQADFGKATAGVSRDELVGRTTKVLAQEPLSAKDLGLRLAEHFPDQAPGDLQNLARMLVPLVQLPPRGMWRRQGGQRYLTAEQWLGASLHPEPDARELVRRYLRAFGPATAADVTTWSGLTGVRAALDAMREELVLHRDEDGRQLVDLAGLDVADEDVPAPVRLLGKYDNLWLSHADRSRVAEPDKRRQWMGRNGGVGATVFVDGMLEGLWREVDGRVVVQPLRRFTRAEQAELDAEVARLEAFLSSP
jgi:hypothetical protein